MGFQLLYNVVIMASAFVHIGLYPVPEVFCPADIFGIKHCGFDVPNLVAAAKAIKIIAKLYSLNFVASFHRAILLLRISIVD